MAKNAVETLQLKPSEASVAIKRMLEVNLENAKLGKNRRGLFMWGGPGLAKSSIVKQIAKEKNLKVIDIRLTQMEPTDLRGIPVPTDGENGRVVVKWAVPDMLPRRSEGSRFAEIMGEEYKDEDGNLTRHKYDGGILLLDELPNAAPSVQAGSYQLVLDGQLGEYIVPDNVVVLAAGNRDTDKGSTFKMPTPLMNRFTHIEVRCDFDDWQTYALNTGFHPDVVGYVTANKGDLNNFDPKTASRGFATPRSWEAVSDIIRGNPNLPEQILTGLVCGTVGDGVGVKFIHYTKNAAKLPKAEDILDGKVKKMAEKDTSLAYALATSMCYELKERSENAKKSKTAGQKFFNESTDNMFSFMMDNFQKEMVVMGLRTVLAIYRIKVDPKQLKTWDRFMKEYSKLVLGTGD